VVNRSDGSVEGVFEGHSAAVEALIEWCRRGPERAQVVEVISVEERTTGTDGFLVL
jgi:acylphosphatase